MRDHLIPEGVMGISRCKHVRTGSYDMCSELHGPPSASFGFSSGKVSCCTCGIVGVMRYRGLGEYTPSAKSCGCYQYGGCSIHHR